MPMTVHSMINDDFSAILFACSGVRVRYILTLTVKYQLSYSKGRFTLAPKDAGSLDICALSQIDGQSWLQLTHVMRKKGKQNGWMDNNGHG